jgi:thiamine-phosphate pyrophosphorylase
MPAPRLYLVAPPVLTEAAIRDLAALLEGFDIACLRLAPAAASEAEIRAQAVALAPLCRARDTTLVVADHFRLVPSLGLDGVHLSDGARHIREARRHLGPDAVVGAFAGASRHDGITAAEIGADYVSFGPVAPSPLGAGTLAPLDLFRWWAEMIETPVVAEGGIDADTAAALAPHADFLGLGAELWSGPNDPAAALRAVLARLPDTT